MLKAPEKPYSIESLRQIMGQLRDPKSGCPWDLKQNFQSVVPYTLEEAYEVAQAIEDQDFDELKDELGDLLLQVIFYTQLAEEAQHFSYADVVTSICEKMVRRHPHVFGSDHADTAEQVLIRWEQIKKEERASKGKQQTSLLDSVPATMPALTRAYKMQKKCSQVGFDWDTAQGAFEKVKEEVKEVEAELSQLSEDKTALHSELGDLLFAVVNVIRKSGTDPESVLRQANQKFQHRFHYVESQCDVLTTNVETMDSHWNAAKEKGL